MYNTFVIKRGDTSPALRYQMPDETSLLGAQVQFQMRNAEGATVIDASALTQSPHVCLRLRSHINVNGGAILVHTGPDAVVYPARSPDR